MKGIVARLIRPCCTFFQNMYQPLQLELLLTDSSCMFLSLVYLAVSCSLFPKHKFNNGREILFRQETEKGRQYTPLVKTLFVVTFLVA
jgi:hypothetical protein